MKDVYLRRLKALKDSSGMSFAALSQKTGISDSTLSRWFKGDGSPDMDDLELICTALGGHFRDILADVGESEMEAAKKVDYMGTDALLAEFEKREKLYQYHCDQMVSHERVLREQQQQAFDNAIQALQDSHKETVAQLKERYTASTNYLKAHNCRLRRSLIVFVALFVVVMIVFIVFILVDAPQIGAGW